MNRHSLLENWRDDAMNKALQTEAREGSSEDALLCAIRRQQPTSSTMMTWLDRSRLLQFLKEQTDNCCSMLSSNHFYCDDEERHYIGWYGAHWQGTMLEIALAPSSYESGYNIVFGNDEKVLKAFVERLNEYSIRPQGRSLRYRQGWETAIELDEEIAKTSWDDVILPVDVTTRLHEAVEGFFSQKEAYRALGFAWRRGILLVGPPGTGKTMICKAIASATSLPFLYVRDLHDRNQREAIHTIFERARKLAPCVLAFEDIDGFVNDSNRAVFLNEMDGFQLNEGLFVVASSNHPEKIDEALLKRPSRFDRVFHIGLPQKSERIEYCRRLLARSGLCDRLSQDFDVEVLALQVAERTDGFTPAYLKEAFTSAALSCAQNGLMTLDNRFAQGVLEQVEELRLYIKRAKNADVLAAMHNGTIGLRR